MMSADFRKTDVGAQIYEANIKGWTYLSGAKATKMPCHALILLVAIFLSY